MYNYPQLTAEDVREVTAKALQSKESALKFLRDAGILDIINEQQKEQSYNLTPETKK